MLNAFVRHKDRLVLMPTEDHQSHLDDALWVDLIDPSAEEREHVGILYGSKLPDADEVDEIEASARFYLDKHGLHIHSLFLHEVDGHPHNTSVAFTLSEKRLFSFREREINIGYC